MNRKAKVIQLIEQGLCNKEVARQAFVAECTVSSIITEVGKSLRAKKRNYLQTLKLIM